MQKNKNALLMCIKRILSREDEGMKSVNSWNISSDQISMRNVQ